MKNHGYRSRYGAGFYGIERRETRRKEAFQRNAYWQSLSLLDQISELDKRFGKDIGAYRQRAKIQMLINAGHTYNPKKEKPNVNYEREQTSRNAKST